MEIQCFANSIISELYKGDAFYQRNMYIDDVVYE